MRRHKPDYEQLGPDPVYLTDEAVLVQAWKKSHAYIRSHNWYSDSLELDLSTLRLRDEIEAWRRNASRSADSFLPEPMRLVPAPKSALWTVPGEQDSKDGQSWRPRDGEKLKLRPLAHLSIRDQTFATAAMICLADRIETEQGNTELPLEDARRVGVVSYGNRLFCTWDGPARFGWGNTETYRKYFLDYRQFVQRPATVAADLAQRGVGEQLAIVQLDLRGFYDRVRRGELIATLRREFSWTDDSGSERFWETLERIVSWRWHPQDVAQLPEYKDLSPEDGLPQGLVASGFFANAYLLGFDRRMKSLVGKKVNDRAWWIMDYCRYVDDLRLVVACDGVRAPELREQVSAWVNKQLAKTAPNQEVNPDKTAVSIFGDSQNGVRVAPAMEAIQRQASGPMDAQTAEAVLEATQGLLPLAEQATIEPHRLLGEPAAGRGDAVDRAVLDLFTTDLDVKADTVERFAANRWRSAFRTLRPMTDGSRGSKSSCPDLVALDEKAALFTARLLRRWIANPSQVLLLKVAMDVRPTPEHLDIVIGLLQRYIDSKEDTKARRICLYVAADLLRAGATETGYVRDTAVLPAGSNLVDYRERLAKFARRCIRRAQRMPWYLLQQALLFLATCDQPVASLDGDSSDLAPYLVLHRVLGGEWEKSGLTAGELVPYVLICHRITRRTTPMAEMLANVLLQNSPDAAARAVEDVLLEDEPLGEKVCDITADRQEHKAWRSFLRNSYCRRRLLQEKLVPLKSLNRRKVQLLDIAAHAENPFAQENAALHFLKRLIEAWAGMEKEVRCLTPENIVVRCKGWERLSDPSTAREIDFLDVTITPASFADHRRDPRYVVPTWCDPSERWRFLLGRILRAAITGRWDYALPFEATPLLTGGYRGVGSSWYKRQFGLFHRPDALGGPGAAVSPWLSELLMSLLYWPGADPSQWCIRDLGLTKSPHGLKRLIIRRLDEQMRLYGRASELPVYETPVTFELKRPPNMTVVMVQTVLPRKEDFTPADPCLNRPEYRVKHARHIAAVAKLVEQMILARGTHDKPIEADLIVFPELCAHPQDLHVLKRLVYRLRAMVFCGLVFHPADGTGPLVNTGRWLVPDFRPAGRAILYLDQGKRHLTEEEENLGVKPYRPCQRIISGGSADEKWRISAALCYDATDLTLAADLAKLTDAFIVSALNQDVATFDNMAAALHYHMYQHLILVNTGEFGGSTAQAPYKDPYRKVLVHCHGNEQIAITICEINLTDCRRLGGLELAGTTMVGHPVRPRATHHPQMKCPPAGLRRLGR